MSTNDSAVWEALGDRSRRAIVDRLAAHPATVAELTRALPLSQPAVSQHLKVLREAGLVAFRPDGARRIYHVRPDGLSALRADLDRFWAAALDNFTRIAEGSAAIQAPAKEKGTRS